MCVLPTPSIYLHQFVNTQRLIQFRQLALVGPAEEGDELLQQRLLVVARLRRGRRAQHLVQRAGHALPAREEEEEEEKHTALA